MSFINACLAFIIYGAWAAYANSEYETIVMVRSGLGQGVYAFISTFFVTASAKYVLAKIEGKLFGVLLAFAVSFIIMLIFPLTIHYFLQTPDVVETIAPGLVWGSFYILFIIKLTYEKSLDVPLNEGLS